MTSILLIQSGLELPNDMSCGGNFTLGLCTLQIEEFRGRLHEGNWTCQLKINSNWINATNFVLVKDVTAPSVVITNYLNDFIEDLVSSIDSVAGLISYFRDS